MAFTQGIQIINGLLGTDQTVTNSIVNIDIGSTGANNTAFSRNLVAGTRIKWKLQGIFSTGATGGFRFLAHSTTAPTTYNATFKIRDLTTPTVFETGIIAEADFTNASAVATNYTLNSYGVLVANAATVFSLQFAQNNATANPITLFKGFTFEVWQF